MAGFVPQSLFLVGLVACCLRWDQSPIARLRSPILFFRQKRAGDRVCLRGVENLGEESVPLIAGQTTPTPAGIRYDDGTMTLTALNFP